MDVRGKLVDLLNEMQDSGIVETPAGFGFTKQYIENDKIASHLIAHGVTVQERGCWNISMDDYGCEMMRCSVCGSEFYDGGNETVGFLHNCCPHCGAKMMPQPPKGE